MYTFKKKKKYVREVDLRDKNNSKTGFEYHYRKLYTF